MADKVADKQADKEGLSALGRERPERCSLSVPKNLSL